MMKSAILAAVVLAVGVAAQGPTINTPTAANPAAECQPFLIQWSGGTPPWLVVVQNSPPSGVAVADFGSRTDNEVTWIVNASVGTSLLFSIKDNTGLPQSSAPFQVTTGSGDSCLSSGGAAPPRLPAVVVVPALRVLLLRVLLVPAVARPEELPQKLPGASTPYIQLFS
ncbi:hypothetical protein B0H17DRAFT_527994 [Mycena rosella]|uniref:Secreted protein n=1 Tax=Mycena rosella TaxID=1033263 RepID=A0AAD7GYA4_MYCRO|nr:hypothetical protein B0H17DRAFT_527994 [Mycena rosella]